MFGIKIGAIQMFDAADKFSGQIEISIDGVVKYQTKRKEDVTGWVPIEEIFYTFARAESKIEIRFKTDLHSFNLENVIDQIVNFSDSELNNTSIKFNSYFVIAF